MSTNTVCRVCLVDNMNLYSVRNDLQNVYERIAREKYNKVGYPVNMCYICLTVLWKCHRFMETARDTNNVLKQWYNQQNEMRVTRPLYTYSISKAEFVSTFNESEILQSDIIVENVKLEQDEVQPEYPECNTDVNIEKTDIDEQTDYSELWLDRPNDCIYTETIEDNNDRQTNPLFDCNEDFEETSSVGLSLDDHTNIETTIKIISPHDNDFPPIKKRKIKLQHRASKSSGETATTSETSNDITPVNITASQHRNTETKPTFGRNNRSGKKTAKFNKILKTNMIRNGNNALPKNTIKNNSSFNKLPLNTYIKKKNYKATVKHLIHHASHTGKKQFFCDVCDLKFTRKCNLVTHMKTHTSETPFSCETCHLKFRQQNQLVSHMRTHTGETPFSCEICENKFAQKGNLKTHMLTHSGKKPFSCDICEYRSTQKVSLQIHILTHSGEKPFSCDICDRKFKSKQLLTFHMITHTGKKPFSCEICEYKFVQKAHLKTHMITHSSEKPFTCEICGYKCARKDYLKSHMMTHTGKKPFSCDICDYRSTQKVCLKRHILNHSGEKPFSCDICDRRFKCKQLLKSHMITHTGKKTFSCEICENKFALKGNLKTHMLTHSGEKPFSCNMCDYKCARKGYLKSHMKTHSGEKPFSCNMCDYKCARTGYLKFHMKTHTSK